MRARHSMQRTRWARALCRARAEWEGAELPELPPRAWRRLWRALQGAKERAKALAGELEASS